MAWFEGVHEVSTLSSSKASLRGDCTSPTGVVDTFSGKNDGGGDGSGGVGGEGVEGAKRRLDGRPIRQVSGIYVG